MQEPGAKRTRKCVVGVWKVVSQGTIGAMNAPAPFLFGQLNEQACYQHYSLICANRNRIFCGVPHCGVSQRRATVKGTDCRRLLHLSLPAFMVVDCCRRTLFTSSVPCRFSAVPLYHSSVYGRVREEARITEFNLQGHLSVLSLSEGTCPLRNTDHHARVQRQKTCLIKHFPNGRRQEFFGETTTARASWLQWRAQRARSGGSRSSRPP